MRKLNGNRSRCGACQQEFNSVAGFDKHRTGNGDGRRCRTPAEMLEAGMALSNGWWVTAKAPDFVRRNKWRDMDRREQDEIYSGINSWTVL